MVDAADKKESGKRTRISQTDVPAYSLEHALRVPIAISENYASKPTKPLDVAAAMNLLPGSSQFKMLTGASIAYGLTDGGYNASEIQLTTLGKKILRPLAEDEDLEGKREALLKPRIINEFLTQYNGSPIPKDVIAQNVLASKGVPEERCSDVLSLILEGAESLGLIQEIKGKKFVNLSSPKISQDVSKTPNPIFIEDDEAEESLPVVEPKNPNHTQNAEVSRAPTADDNRRVFVTHGKK